MAVTTIKQDYLLQWLQHMYSATADRWGVMLGPVLTSKADEPNEWGLGAMLMVDDKKYVAAVVAPSPFDSVPDADYWERFVHALRESGSPPEELHDAFNEMVRRHNDEILVGLGIKRVDVAINGEFVDFE